MNDISKVLVSSGGESLSDDKPVPVESDPAEQADEVGDDANCITVMHVIVYEHE